MSKSCTFEMRGRHCGSAAFNLQWDGIEQGDYCDKHYWQSRAEKAEADRAKRGHAYTPDCYAHGCAALPVQQAPEYFTSFKDWMHAVYGAEYVAYNFDFDSDDMQLAYRAGWDSQQARVPDVDAVRYRFMRDGTGDIAAFVARDDGRFHGMSGDELDAALDAALAAAPTPPQEPK